ncbi:GvpL/GvpF family gas vesicle protein [Parasphingorhabdus pacifica]
MSTRAEQETSEEPGVVQGVYVYGLLPEPASLPEGLPSVGDADEEVRTATYGQLSALVSDVHLSRPLGTRDDLLAHERVLDTLAADSTVLPMRFGAVVEDADAVVDELLKPHHEHFESVLSELAGLVQFTVRGRYVEDEHLHEIVAEQQEIRELREALQGIPDDAGHAERLRLGELVNNAVAHKRQADADVLNATVSPHAVATVTHEVGGERDAVSMAFLVDRGHQAEFERALDELGQKWTHRIQLRLLGPLAPYDFLPDG